MLGRNHILQIKVRQGDTLWYYSQLFRMSLSLLIDANTHLNPNHISVGQVINIPGFTTTNYVIARGDTFWNIAANKNIPLDMLLLTNEGLDPHSLQIGQTIQLPLRVTWPVVQGNQLYDYETLTSHIAQLTALYPFIRHHSIGTSVMGKPIPHIQIGRGSKRVHINAAFHANEWITTPVLMRFLNEYLLALTNGSSIRGRVMSPLYEQTMLSIVPMVNPDGVNLVIQGPPAEAPFHEQVLQINEGSNDFSGWKANIRGVDLNNQYPALWEVEAERKPKQPAPRDYPGPAPLTEPEAIAMAELTIQGDFRRVLAFHTQGEVIYWGFLNLEPPESETIVTEFARVSGYTPVRTVDSYAGYKDWFIQDWRRPGFTIELGRGVNPLPLTQFETIYQQSLGILLANLYL